MGARVMTRENPYPEGAGTGRVEYVDRNGKRVSVPEYMATDEFYDIPRPLYGAELVFGQLRVAENAPSLHHQSILGDLYLLLAPFVRERRLGNVWFAPLSVTLDHRRRLVVQPDMFFISTQRMPSVTDRICVPPDLVIEVLSPSQRPSEVMERLRWFAEYDVRECWVVRQREQRTDVVKFEGGAVETTVSIPWTDPLQSDVLPDFRPVLSPVLTQY